ncbi:Hypothetical predicted protein [Pelobates cultripes]|uniref:Uncharacterized protein n=1 Tax=Pelobates cultripes TaxID=61616 RepID=A0AAD1WCN8_PELCU|nr:Hypothetical predicted protein [Pelobates cultripes]
MNNIRVFLNAALNILRDDITVVTARVQATEDCIHSITQQQTSTKEQMQQLQATNKAMQIRIDTMDDAQRCKNLKIRGITETISDQELPDLIRRLLCTLLTQQSARGIQIDGCFRLAKSSRTPAGAPAPGQTCNPRSCEKTKHHFNSKQCSSSLCKTYAAPVYARPMPILRLETSLSTTHEDPTNGEH